MVKPTDVATNDDDVLDDELDDEIGIVDGVAGATVGGIVAGSVTGTVDGIVDGAVVVVGTTFIPEIKVGSAIEIVSGSSANCPKELLPQQYNSPVAFTAHACAPPASMSTIVPVMPLTTADEYLLAVPPSPNCFKIFFADLKLFGIYGHLSDVLLCFLQSYDSPKNLLLHKNTNNLFFRFPIQHL